MHGLHVLQARMAAQQAAFLATAGGISSDEEDEEQQQEMEVDAVERWGLGCRAAGCAALAHMPIVITSPDSLATALSPNAMAWCLS